MNSYQCNCWLGAAIILMDIFQFTFPPTRSESPCFSALHNHGWYCSVGFENLVQSSGGLEKTKPVYIYMTLLVFQTIFLLILFHPQKKPLEAEILILQSIERIVTCVFHRRGERGMK